MSMEEREERVEGYTIVKSALQRTVEDSALIEARQRVWEIQSKLTEALRSLNFVQNGRNREKKSLRKGFLVSLKEMIGEEPTISWQDELRQNVEMLHFTWEDFGNKLESLEKALTSVNASGEKNASMMKVGWTEDDIYTFSSLCWPAIRYSMGDCLRKRTPTFASCTYAMCRTLYINAKKQMKSSRPYQKMYRHLLGEYSLAEGDEGWNSIKESDKYGFRGFTSTTLTRARYDENIFTQEGFLQYIFSHDKEVIQDSPIVCFESLEPTDDGAFHHIIITEENYGVFPPNTLFRLQRIEKAGTWMAPNGVYPQQELIYVTATYRAPLEGASRLTNGKLCGSPITLEYGNRGAYLQGLDDIIDQPVLSMHMEFNRDMEWMDWKGVTYTLKEEWAYVIGKASMKDCTPGVRDEKNDGLTLDDFISRVNDHIKDCRDKAVAAGSSLKLSPQYAFLSMEEVLSIRLYTGPAYQPINLFLRQIGKLSGSYRQALTKDVNLTFAATIGHIYSAIRKLAALTTAEESKVSKLYRCVRGELPRSFWLPDELGMICAVDMAFMSTSKSKSTCVEYMQKDGENVLWQISSSGEDDSGYHNGADVALLSQFAQEEEVLFPPCCLLTGKFSDIDNSSDGGKQLQQREEIRCQSTHCIESCKSFIEVPIYPSFV